MSLSLWEQIGIWMFVGLSDDNLFSYRFYETLEICNITSNTMYNLNMMEIGWGICWEKSDLHELLVLGIEQNN